jgi:GNAT superfamily N-acetyltransferase
MHIRPADASDLTTLAVLFDGYRRFYGQSADLSACTAFMQERLDAGDSRILIAVNESGEGLGFTQLYPSFSSVRMRPVWILNDLFVAPSARGGGVASALMTAAADWAASADVAALSLETARDNAAARALYEKLGWQLDTEFDHYTINL